MPLDQSGHEEHFLVIGTHKLRTMCATGIKNCRDLHLTFLRSSRSNVIPDSESLGSFVECIGDSRPLYSLKVKVSAV